ncbi:GspE/PulE family protein [Nitrospirillum pindoramense]|uniref:Type II secretion system protein E (GspE) n=1 Tax=Nitrospirillum amazonense TaxID=28077 RepID=A0A560HHN7_9PROT|nr:GspE/PulE family protein [Nitrospirillum amazonense]TWB45973.1 type II secretion system protein E (GspE) [Nitrospirillum amazonense]
MIPHQHSAAHAVSDISGPDDGALDRVLSALAAQGQLSPGALGRAQAAGGRVDRRLLDLGLVSEEHMAAAYAQALGLALWPADHLPQAPAMMDVANLAFLKAKLMLPLTDEGAEVVFAMADPLDGQALGAAAFLAGRPVRPVVMTGTAIAAALDRLYEPAQPAANQDAMPDLLEGDAERLRDLASEGPVVRLVGNAIQAALAAGATDIHVEPMADRLVIRHRIDGILREAEVLPRRTAAGVITRIKVMAGLDIGERRLPQDGRIRQTLQGREIDFRVSTTPTVHGEDVVMRILDQQTAGGRLDSLGLPAWVAEPLTAQLDRPHGIVLVTGPTGSGKTTTLYAGLRGMDAARRKILTVEDPVEYLLDGINQTQVKPGIGLTFAHALRSFLRQDPDVILVGEMRDGETTKVAVQAALTGHLVLSTLHTNDAAGAVPRLMDMGVDPYLLASTLNGVLAQRLVRTLCPTCRQPHTLSADAAAALGLPARETIVHRAVGCPACNGTGYRGRSAIAEWLPITDAVRTLIRQGASSAEIEAAAVQTGGMVPLYQDGLQRVLDGVTTPEEILRVTKAD